MSGVYFTKDELLEIDVEHLRNILDYLGVTYEKKNTKSKLIQMIMDAQVEAQPFFNDAPTETPKYSVRIKRIMDAKEKGQLI